MSVKPIYLDHAAATPLDAQVLAAMQPYLTNDYYNPSAPYLAAKKVRKDIEAARALVASHLGTRSAEMIFTSGGTESNNLAINGIMRQHPKANIVVSAVEHDAVIEPAQMYDCTITPVMVDGRIDIDSLSTNIDDNTVLVSIMYANNEIGTIQPLKRIAAVIAEIRQRRRREGNKMPLYFHSDACQAAVYLDLHVSRIGVDLMTLNAGKIYGPKQSGALYVRAGIELTAQILGGGQERSIRSGTESPASIIGFAKALELVQSNRAHEVKRLASLQKYFVDALVKQFNVSIQGSMAYRLPNNVHAQFPGVDNERLVMSLDEHGILAAAGSACSASDDEPSHVLHAIGLSDSEARSSLRFTMGRSTTQDEVDHVLHILAQLL